MSSINEVKTSRFDSQRQWLLYKMAKARAAVGVVIGVKHNGHHGWLQTYQLRGVETGDNADRRMRELRNLQNFPIVMEKIEIMVKGKKKRVPHFCLDLDPNTLDWDQIIEKGADYIFARKPIPFTIKASDYGVNVACKKVGLKFWSCDRDQAESSIAGYIQERLDLAKEKQPEAYAKFIRKYDINRIIEV